MSCQVRAVSQSTQSLVSRGQAKVRSGQVRSGQVTSRSGQVMSGQVSCDVSSGLANSDHNNEG